MRIPIPLRQRPFDVLLITYVVSLEQLVIVDINHFTPPLWPPAKLLAVVGANAAWLLMPFVVGWRVLRAEHPFTVEPAGSRGPAA
jgi:hypothetical protein